MFHELSSLWDVITRDKNAFFEFYCSNRKPHISSSSKREHISFMCLIFDECIRKAMIWSRAGRFHRRHSWKTVLGHLVLHPYGLQHLPHLLKRVASSTFSDFSSKDNGSIGDHIDKMLQVLETQMAQHFPLQFSVTNLWERNVLFSQQ